MSGPWKTAELAAVSGEPESSLLWMEDVGLLHREEDDRFGADSLHRIRLVRFARARGVEDDALASAVAAQGDLLGIFVGLEPHEEAAVDLAAEAQELGLDDDIAEKLLQILDLDDGYSGTESDVVGMRIVARAIELGFPPDPLLQLIRFISHIMDRLADAEVRTFHNHVHERFRAEGLTGRELLVATQSVGLPILELVEPALVHAHRRAYERANGEDLLRHLSEQTTPAADVPGEEQATVLFVDLASFTPLTSAMGDEVAADVLDQFGDMVRRSAAGHSGRVLKQIGDAFMVVFAEPAPAVEFGLELQHMVEDQSRFPALHIGAHHGSVLYREGDYVGAAVNLAARVASAGAGGEFLVTDEVQSLAGQVGDVEFVRLPPRRLKGLSDPIVLIEVRSSERATGRERDPVCGMVLDPPDIAARSIFREEEFVFCSAMCKDAFDADPTRYVAGN